MKMTIFLTLILSIFAVSACQTASTETASRAQTNVVRYSPESMHGEFGDQFRLVRSVKESHETPFGTTQEFVYCYCRKL